MWTSLPRNMMSPIETCWNHSFLREWVWIPLSCFFWPFYSLFAVFCGFFSFFCLTFLFLVCRMIYQVLWRHFAFLLLLRFFCCFLLCHGVVLPFFVSFSLLDFASGLVSLPFLCFSSLSVPCWVFVFLVVAFFPFSLSVSSFSHTSWFVLLPIFVCFLLAAKHGSISAEHGIGLQKSNFLHFSKSPGAIAMMQKLKRDFDPHGILNPYKVLPSSSPVVDSSILSRWPRSNSR